MASPASLRLRHTIDAQARAGQENAYQVTGVDPQWIYALDSPQQAKRAGLLSLSVSCDTPNVLPVIQVFWRSTDEGFSEDSSVVFEASFPVNLVPLDASPRWSPATDIAEIRVDIANPDRCTKATVANVRLIDRK